MIVSFGDQTTHDIFHGIPSRHSRKLAPHLTEIAWRKLDLINSASCTLDLKSSPSNRLEALKGNLKGFHSIRINDQYRIVFKMGGEAVSDVKIVDYH